MGAVDPRVSRVLDELVPPRPGPDRWDAIVHAAGGARPGRRLVAAVPVAAVALVAAVLALAWPFGSGPQGTILERAAAAIGDGPVLHVVIRSGWGGTLVDLDTAARTRIHAETEAWYDPTRGIHEIWRFGGVVEGEVITPVGRDFSPEKTLAAIATDYRDALRDGTARVLESAALRGEPVYWIRVESGMFPDVADGKLHELARDVAVSQETFEVVATRETFDGELQPDGISIVLEAESLPAGEGDFTRATPDRTGVNTQIGARDGSLTLSEASAVLGRPAVWAGRRVGGLELARVWTDVRKVRNGGPGAWKEFNGVTFFYGTLDEADSAPTLPALQTDPEPYVRIAQSTRLDPGFRRGVRSYVPPEGSVLVNGGRLGAMYSDGVHVGIEASSEELLMAAARALEPVPER